MNNNDNSAAAVAEDEKILHARNLLKKFQSKQSQQQPRNSAPGSVNGSEASAPAIFPFNNSGTAAGHGQQQLLLMDNSSSCTESLCHDQLDEASISQPSKSRDSSRPPSSVGRAGNVLGTENSSGFEPFRCHSVPKNFNQAENPETNTLRNTLAQKQRELDDALVKLQSLHKHYADLHTAYSKLVSQNSALNGQGKGSVPAAHAEQIHQLRTALAVAIDEKTALQSELREAKLQIQQISMAQAQQAATSAHQRPTEFPSKSNYELDARLTRLTAERYQLQEAVRNQSLQIEKQRKECSGLEAKLVLIQQDRLDTQARLKSIYEEKAQLQQSFEQLRQELAMRDIHLRQMARHSAGGEQQQAMESAHLENSDAKKHLEEELERHRAELAEARKQMDAAREHYQCSVNQTNAHIQKLENELGQLRHTKAELESTNSYLEEQLRIAQTTIQALNEIQPKIDPVELVKMREQIAGLAAERTKALESGKEIAQKLEKKCEELDALRMALAEAERKIAMMESQQSIQSTISTDAALLSAQLQNEKATVSRAIAQNMELKAQLAELQDRLVQVLNESAQKEDERVTALATVARLTQQLEMGRGQQQTEEIAVEAVENGESKENLSMVAAPAVDVPPQVQAVHVEEQLNESTIEPETNASEKRQFSTIAIQTDEEEQQRQIVTDNVDQRCHVPMADENADENRANSAPLPTTEQMGIMPRTSTASTTSTEFDHQTQTHHHQQMSNELEHRLEHISRENQQFRMDNQKLQYWLTALESENESIGEYIALYRFQRGNIQKRMAEKDQQLAQLQQQNGALMAQMTELHNSVLAFLAQQQQREREEQEQPGRKLAPKFSIGDEDDEEEHVHSNSQAEENPEGHGKEENGQIEQRESPQIGNEQQVQNDNELDRLMRVLERSKAFTDCQAALPTAPNCSSAAIASAQEQAQIQCTGCVECRGELFTL